MERAGSSSREGAELGAALPPVGQVKIEQLLGRVLTAIREGVNSY